MRDTPGVLPRCGVDPDPPFRFGIGARVVVVSHPGRPPGAVVARCRGDALGDPYRENIYQLSSFVTKQRESSLAPADGD